MKLLTRDQVAARLSLEPRTVERWTNRGRIGHVTVDGKKMYRSDHIGQLIADHRVSA